MSRFIGFVKKEFSHIFRDYRTMLILFGMPVAQILIFGYVVSNEIKDIKIAIYDKSKDNVTQEITNKILSSGYFIIDKNIDNDNQVEDAFKKGNIREVIIFEPHFAEKLEREGKASIQILADASDANTANIVSNYTSAIIRTYMKNELMKGELPFVIDTKVQILYNKELKGVYMFVPGTMALILMLVSAMMTSISITREKEMGTMEVLLVSPLRPMPIILGKVIPYVGLAFMNALVIIALSYFVFDMPMQGNLTFLLLETLLFILMALSLGILISTVSKSQMMAMFISMFALMLPTMLLSGFIFPIENMPKILQWLSSIMPARYFIVIVKNIMIKGSGILVVWKETLYLTGITILFLVISIKKFKVRLE
ncbi:MAG: multidrug ABC transporter permease [Bacteroidetes bacterium GWC2_33_15]|nr:MAG: multidrug ABC transporter permease [Bacteroidetes bacterium GWA2_33_15]OFX48649.1 MAG: multidrug ABC transporter permease [Bacteroidetes bacterium GWC2_33_15]OFX64623.1 MAG: multidrug ABC transporter permease [Bacteroidetes bacterium GWB2_32_14]OFX67959.1 MAG: multidrug ABC transporter permease [Bacteroidetes bacterium GWD2_33_33]HAN18191.1 multidrug ABC transporter permease [Bacteroidales bacterium]